MGKTKNAWTMRMPRTGHAFKPDLLLSFWHEPGEVGRCQVPAKTS